MKLNTLFIALVMLIMSSCVKEDNDLLLPGPEPTDEELSLIADDYVISAQLNSLPGTYSFVVDTDTLGWWRFHQPTIGGVYPYGSSHPGTYEPLDSITHDVTLIVPDTMRFIDAFGTVSLYTYQWVNPSLLQMTNLEFNVDFELRKWQ